MTLVLADLARNTRSAMEPNLEKIYRVMVGDKGIFEAVDTDCPKGDSRRANKPDGSWLPKKGTDYPGAVSFWTERGFQKYKDSGLMDWHMSVVNGKVEIITIDRPDNILHEDEWQVIVDPVHAGHARKI